MSEDPFDDPQTRAWLDAVRTDMLPKLRASALSVSIVPDDPSDLDLKFAVELGAAIMLDKPLIMVVKPGTLVPDHLVRVADEIVEVDLATPEAAGRIRAALARHVDLDEQ